MIAEIMKATFGKKLVDAPIQGHDLSGEDAVLPSPEQLKERILLKVSQPLCLGPIYPYSILRTDKESQHFRKQREGGSS